MKLEELILDAITRSTTEVFSTMLDAQIRRGEPSVENSSPEANDGLVSFIGLAGAWAGAGSLACSAAMACRVCARMLMTESAAVNEEVLDAVAELTNMIIGGVKNDLEVRLGPIGLSIPTVVYGRNFKTKGAGHADWLVAPFYWDDDPLLVKLCLAPGEKAHAQLHALGQTCPVEI